jgi:uncharacterized protein YjeT (DUF2065 family)
VGDLWAALCLVLVIEGLFLFAAPAAWRRTIVQLLEQPDRRISAIGGVMVIAGIVALYLLRGA